MQKKTEALKNLYEALGGTRADVANINVTILGVEGTYTGE